MHRAFQRLAGIAGLCAALVWESPLWSQEETPAAPAQTEPGDKPAEKAPPGTQEEYFELMQVFAETFERIDRDYVKDVDRRQLLDAAVRGMLSQLDPYSDYIGPKDLDRFTEAVEQEFGGVGIQVHWDADKRELEVVSPLPGSPAYKAGIKAGDRIVEIEGEDVHNFPQDRELPKAISLLKGEAGVNVTIGVRHPDKEEVEKITLTRAVIQLDTVLGDSRGSDGQWDFMLDDEKKIAYLRLTHFTRRSAEEMRNAITKLENDGMEAMILDLRYNPGGLLQSAVEIADLFIEDGVIVSTDGRNSLERSWFARKFGSHTGFPMVVLVNRYSASASEIVSACLQDHKRAVIVGDRTWGKGSVQNVIPLEEGEAALKLTTASYHRPSGKNIHRFPDSKETDEWGVSPDDGFKVAFTGDQDRDYQLFRQERDTPRDGTPPDSEFEDTQLAKAIESVNTQLTTPAASETATDAADSEKPAEEAPTEKKPTTGA